MAKIPRNPLKILKEIVGESHKNTKVYWKVAIPVDNLLRIFLINEEQWNNEDIIFQWTSENLLGESYEQIVE